MKPNVRRINAFAAADDRREWSGGVSVLIEDARAAGRDGAWRWRLLAIGRRGEVDGHEASGRAEVVDLPGAVLLPGMVNAHTHLDLTHIGPHPHNAGEGFVSWVDMIRARRHTDPARIAESVRRGVELSRSAGVVLIGDIAGAPRGRGSLAPAVAMEEAGMAGVSFLEFFGIGKWMWRAAEWLPERLAEAGRLGGVSGGVRIGLQPHAPNTVDRRVYEWSGRLANALGLRVCTHCAETPEERRFVAEGAGPQREMLERLGVWDESALECVGQGKGPVEHVVGALAGAEGPVLVHVNDADERDVERIARAGASVVYCPRASAYFDSERHFGGHRYREMVSAGVCVALGTDSLVNLPEGCERTVGQGGRGMGVWDEARYLWKRDGGKASALLRMATTAGAEVLGWDLGAFRWLPVGEGAAGGEGWLSGVSVVDGGFEGRGVGGRGVVRAALESDVAVYNLL
ncbi:MAG: amidohydrolase family protein [Phycisphaeraceae bacterium]|nr:amidohydrolase family protein [Phycisphaeraceae bacterium]